MRYVSIVFFKIDIPAVFLILLFLKLRNEFETTVSVPKEESEGIYSN